MPGSNSVEQFKKAAQGGKVAPIYVTSGGEPLLLDEVMRAVRDAVDETTRDFNFDVFYGDDLDAGSFASALGALPMMAERRAVVVKRAESIGTQLANYLVEYAKNPVESTLLVLLFEGSSKKAWIQKVSKEATSINCEAPRGKTLRDWILKTASNLGVELEREALELMTEGRQPRLIDLEGELVKASLLVEEGETITLPVLQQVWGMEPDVDIWRFYDRSTAGQRELALQDILLLRESLEHPQGAGMFLSQTAKRLRLAWKEKRYDALRVPFADRKWSGSTKWQWGKVSSQLKSMPLTQAEAGLERLLDIDRTRKTQSLETVAAFERFIHRMALDRKGGKG
ncbi:DNA polymerase III subunit delta [bacterium]|nr:DNA polymerase III subunit delta [bacterium]